MTDIKAYLAAKRIAKHMSRTFMEYLPTRFRKATLMIFKTKIGGRIRYELRIASKKAGLYRYPYYPKKFTSKELWDIEWFMRNTKLESAKPKMKNLKSSRTKAGVI